MFPDVPVLQPTRTVLSIQDVKEYLDMWGDDVKSALNPTHKGTIAAIKERYDIDPPIPGVAEQIVLEPGDYLLVFQIKFKRRLAEGDRYTQEEIDGAELKFRLWTI